MPLRSIGFQCLIVALVAMTWGWPAAAQQDVFTVDDIAVMQYVTAVKMSPDGQHVAYTKAVQRDPKNDESGGAWSELHVVDREGNSRPFITGKVNVGSIDWTPDGSGISYLARRNDDKNTGLYVIPIGGGESSKLAELKDTSISSYSWRRDGLQVALVASEPQDQDEKKLAEKGFNPEIYEEQVRHTKIWTVDADPHTDDEPKQLDTPGSASEVQFSPDGTSLVAAIAETPLIDHFYMYRRLHVLEAETGEVQSRISNPGKLGEVAWSPDGNYIAFMSGEDINDPSEGRLMVASASGGQPTELMKDYLPNISGVHWQDNDTILFTADDGCLTALGSVHRDGANRQLMIEPGGAVLTGMSAAADHSSFAFLGQTPTHPNEVFVYDRSGDPTRLTDTNPWFESKQFAEQEIVRYQAKKDGETVEGILVYPLNYNPNQRYPLIVVVHGGPESHVPNGWVTRYSNPGQVGAAEGFAVFYPNYRGSTGRGVAFAKAHQADYGGQEFDDVIDGIDHLMARGIADKDRVGITGGSYGGFATAWCCTRHSDRFAAGVMFVGISNQISKSGTTDIPDEMFHVHARKRIWDDWQFFLERSPIYHVKNCRTPLLILHGKNDTRVHPSQSMELYRNLKILNQAPVRLVFYPGEGHGNRKSAARYDYSLRLMRWMKHYLTGPGGDAPPYQIDYGLEAKAAEDEEKDAGDD